MIKKRAIHQTVHAVTDSTILADQIILKFLSDPRGSQKGDLVELKYPDGSLSRFFLVNRQEDRMEVDCSGLNFTLKPDTAYSYKLDISPSDRESVSDPAQRARYQHKPKFLENVLFTTIDEPDIRHGVEFVIENGAPIRPGTTIAIQSPGGETRQLTVILEKMAAIWLALWHDETGKSQHNGELFRLTLIPPVEYEDDLPSRRVLKAELIGDHELPSPWGAE